MSKYNWSKQYQIPDLSFQSTNKPTQSGFTSPRLRKTIDYSLFRHESTYIGLQRKNSIHNATLKYDFMGKASTGIPNKGYSQRENNIEPNNSFNIKRRATCQDKKTKQSSKKYTPQFLASQQLSNNYSAKTYRQSQDLGARSSQAFYNQRDRLFSSNANKTNVKSFTASPYTSKKEIKAKQSVDSPMTFWKKGMFPLPSSSSPYQKMNNAQNVQDEIETVCTTPKISEISVSQFKFKSPLKKKHSMSRQFAEVSPPCLEDFVVVKHLGEGRFGAVSMAIHKKSGLLFALKKVKKAIIKENKIEQQFIMELKMQMFFDHPNILKLYGVFDDTQNFYLILEFMQEGTLFGKLKKQKTFEESEASCKMNDVLHAVKYMHQQEIAHRDIKPQNIVISNGLCKLCDFGWAAICEDRRTTLCGTIDYAPPEVLQGKQYGYSMDLWCLGVLCYELIMGKAPFYHMSRKQTMQKIVAADSNQVKFSANQSSESIDFISRMLIKDPQDRMHAQDGLKHKFITKYLDVQNEKLRSK